jgi:hypothetical protein
MRKTPFTGFFLVFALLAPASNAFAAGAKDDAALKIDSDAMAKDYLETRFAQAKTKLEKAISGCGKDACSPKVLARLHRDLGIVLVGGMNKSADGKKEFQKARELDPKIVLDKDFANPAMKKLWAESGSGGGSGEGAPKIDHTPVTEQKTGYPIPIYAVVDSAPEGSEVRLWYKSADKPVWGHLTMTKRGDGYGAEVPCDMTGKDGEVAYFVAVQSSEGEVLASNGSREEPLKLELKKEVDGDGPHFPDGEPPKRCTEEAEGETKPEVGGARKNWFYLTFEQDIAVIGAGTGVCAPDIRAEGQWSCFRSDGSQYRGTPVHGQGDAVNGGLGAATTRIHLGYDRVLVGGLTTGVRAGVAIRGTAPSSSATTAGHSAFPAYFEARAAYWFGSDPFASDGLRPFLLIDGGVASVDAEKSTEVREQRGVPSTQKNPNTQTLDAWRSLGNGFFGGGLGLMYAFTPRVGMLLDVRYARFVGRDGNALMPEIGLGFGL